MYINDWAVLLSAANRGQYGMQYLSQWWLAALCRLGFSWC